MFAKNAPFGYYFVLGVTIRVPKDLNRAMFIDSHAHLEMGEFGKDLPKVLDRALRGGVSHIISVGTDLQSSRKAIALAREHDFIFASLGYHPHNASEMDARKLQKLGSLASEPKILAWGEIGLDFYRLRSPADVQTAVFVQQLGLADQLDLPVIIHVREAHREVLEILQKKGRGKNQGVIHCFSGDYDLAMAFISLGYFISIPGTVTYKNARQVRDVAARIPVDRLLLETDAPFLAPVPKRGKRNEPLFVTYIAEEIARLREMDLEGVAHQTSENAKRLFNLGTP